MRRRRRRRKDRRECDASLCFMCYPKIDSLCLPSNDFLAALSPFPILFLILLKHHQAVLSLHSIHFHGWKTWFLLRTQAKKKEEQEEREQKILWVKRANGMKQKWWSTMRKADAMLLFSRFFPRLSDYLSGFMCLRVTSSFRNPFHSNV